MLHSLKGDPGIQEEHPWRSDIQQEKIPRKNGGRKCHHHEPGCLQCYIIFLIQFSVRWYLYVCCDVFYPSLTPSALKAASVPLQSLPCLLSSTCSTRHQTMASTMPIALPTKTLRQSYFTWDHASQLQDNSTNVVETVWNHPIGKSPTSSGAFVALLYAAHSSTAHEMSKQDIAHEMSSLLVSKNISPSTQPFLSCGPDSQCDLAIPPSWRVRVPFITKETWQWCNHNLATHLKSESKD